VHHLVNVLSEGASAAEEEASTLRNAPGVIMVRGESAGQENVSVVLQEWRDFYSQGSGTGEAGALSVPADWIVLTVAEEFLVDPPSPILLLVGSTLALKILHGSWKKIQGYSNFSLAASLSLLSPFLLSRVAFPCMLKVAKGRSQVAALCYEPD